MYSSVAMKFSKICGHRLFASTTISGFRWYAAALKRTPSLKLKPEQIKKICEEKRQWQFTQLGKQHLRAHQEGIDFTIMSYNILSQKNLLDCLYLYDHCEDKVLQWKNRAPAILTELTSHNCDVICLQEVEETAYVESFSPCLERLGYCGFFKKKTGDHIDGCAMFFKKEVFEVENIVEVEFRKVEVPILNRHNICLIALLKAKNGQKVIVATTHLLYNPRRGDVKLCQLRVMLAEIDKLAFMKYSDVGQPKYCPVLLCGDFNSEPFSPLYNFVTCGSFFIGDMKSGTVSGQPHGKNKGQPLQKNDLMLLPLGINNSSKYEKIDCLRYNPVISMDASAQDACASTSCECDLKTKTEMAAVEDTASQSAEMKTKVKRPLDFFSHNLNFMSAYKHINFYGVPEVTIHNNDSCGTVDYIFYNVDKKYSFVANEKPTHACVTEGHLHLLGNLSLLGVKDLEQMGGLPNAFLASDHTCLISRFLLTSE